MIYYQKTLIHRRFHIKMCQICINKINSYVQNRWYTHVHFIYRLLQHNKKLLWKKFSISKKKCHINFHLSDSHKFSHLCTRKRLFLLPFPFKRHFFKKHLIKCAFLSFNFFLAKEKKINVTLFSFLLWQDNVIISIFLCHEIQHIISGLSAEESEKEISVWNWWI